VPLGLIVGGDEVLQAEDPMRWLPLRLRLCLREPLPVVTVLE
jgi:hypothetical protein